MIDSVSIPPDNTLSTGQFIEQYHKELELGITKPEHMKCEQLRFNSFKHRPYQAYRGVWPSQLARAGFYYDARHNETVCAWCSLRKAASYWSKGTNPQLVHKTESRNCEYITGECKENIPFHTKAQRINKLSYLEPNCTTFIQDNINSQRIVADSGSSNATAIPSVSISAPTVTQESNAFSIQSRPRNRLTPPANRTREVAQSLPLNSSRDSLFAATAQRNEPPFQSLPVIANPGSLPAPPNSGPGSLVADHPNEVANSTRGNNNSVGRNTSAPASLPYQSRNNSAPASLPYQSMSTGSLTSRNNNMNTRQQQQQHEMFDGDGPDPLQRMKSEEARLMTFTRWPNHAAVSPEDLARAGFFYTGSTDRVQCAYCENVLRNWEPGDNPTFEHRRHFPRCRYVLGQDVGNVPIPPAQRQRCQANLAARSHGMTPAGVGRQQPQANTWSGLQQPYQQPQRQTGTSALGMMGVNTELPKHPEYAIEASRLLTYRTWRADMPQPADVLCRAGFFYTGQDDNVRCFFCDGGLRNWEREDDPFTEHARWFPRCAFIREVRGEDFVNALTARYPRVQNLPNVAAQEPVPVPPVTPATRVGGGGGGSSAGGSGGGGRGGMSSASSGYHSGPQSATTSSSRNTRPTRIPGVQYRVEEREVKARMDTPAVRAVLDMGFDRNIVLNAIRKQLRQRGEDFSSAEMLLEALFDEEDQQLAEEEEEMEQEQSEEPANSTPEPARMLPGGGQPAEPPPDTTGPAPSPSTPNPPAAPATSATQGANNTSNTEGATANNENSNSAAGGATSTTSSGKTRKRRNKKKTGATGSSSGKQGETTTNTPPPENSPPEDSAVASASAGKEGKKPNTETKTLLEENRQLKDQRMCKVCMDAEANIVFLPCGHLVCCANCAPALRNCAVCRSLIRGTVRTYLS